MIVIFVNPKDIIYLCPISGGYNSRLKRIKDYGYKMDDDRLHVSGDWDLTTNPPQSCLDDFTKYLAGKVPGYTHWKALHESLIKNGYKNERHRLCVCIGRKGNIMLADGRHRWALANYLNIPLIPVEVSFIHKLYKGDLSCYQKTSIEE